MNSAALLYNADCVYIDLQQGWCSMEAKIEAIDDAIDTILAMENSSRSSSTPTSRTSGSTPSGL
eukprot:15416457-Alexandrium_andersonii.AAC.1